MKRLRISQLTLLSCFLVMVIYRGVNIHSKEISWDAFGYYLPLPATFIHGDPLLDDPSWIYEANRKYELSQTVFQIIPNDDGIPTYLFLFGEALFYAPGFFIAHAIAHFTNYPTDGFSLPYQYVLSIWMLFYVLIGLLYLEKILRIWFNDKIVAITLFTIVLGTNYLEHLTIKNLETVNVLFMLVAIIVWHSHKWYSKERVKDLYILAIASALIILVKPSEIIIGIVPLLWGIISYSGLMERLTFWKRNIRQLILSVVIGLLVLSPQLIYWYAQTGAVIYDSYNNPGIGLDMFEPHFYETLIGFRKGWLLYTPVMLFSLLGFITLRKRIPDLFPILLVYFLLEIWIISSWTEWWYGAGYSLRPIITAYPILAIAFASWIEYMVQKSRTTRFLQYALLAILIGHNLFQMWQMKYGIVDLTRSTKAYYMKNFLATQLNLEDQALLLVDRRSTVKDYLPNHSAYDTDTLNIDWFKVNHHLVSEEFVLDYRQPYNELTTGDHIWLGLNATLCIDSTQQQSDPVVVFAVERKEGLYAYTTKEIHLSENKQCATFEVFFLSPHIRNSQDEIHLYLWNRSHSELIVDDWKVSVSQPINSSD